MENGCRLVLRNSRKKILILVETWMQIVDKFKKNNEQKIRDNNGEIKTILRLDTLVKENSTCSQHCDAS